MEDELRYPASATAGDLLRGLAGLLASTLPLALAQPPRWLALTLAVLAGLFSWYLLVTLRRASCRYRLDQSGLRLLRGASVIDWRALDLLHLDYYSTRRDGREGWFELRLRSGGRVLRVDSRLEGFDRVLTHALRAAEARALELAPATLSNLDALGLSGAAARSR